MKVRFSNCSISSFLNWIYCSWFSSIWFIFSISSSFYSIYSRQPCSSYLIKFISQSRFFSLFSVACCDSCVSWNDDFKFIKSVPWFSNASFKLARSLSSSCTFYSRSIILNSLPVSYLSISKTAYSCSLLSLAIFSSYSVFSVSEFF